MFYFSLVYIVYLLFDTLRCICFTILEFYITFNILFTLLYLPCEKRKNNYLEYCNRHHNIYYVMIGSPEYGDVISMLR